MTQQLQEEIMKHEIFMNDKLFHSLVYLYTESQQWQKILILLQQINKDNCEPEKASITFLKRNLVYCFEASLSSSLKEMIEVAESTFFKSAAAREEARKVWQDKQKKQEEKKQ